jgi:hypothetical protein
MPMAAQPFDLLYAYLGIRLLAECPPDRDGKSPTATWLRYPGQHRVWMSDHDRAPVNCGCGAKDVLSVSQSPRRWMRPSCTIQGKQLGTLCRNLPDEVSFRPLLVLAHPLNGRITTVPLTTEGRQKAQLGKRADWPSQKQCIDQFKLGIAGFSESVFVSDLTKLDKVVKLLHGGNLWHWFTLSFHHRAVSRKSRAALIICLDSSTN